jgi:HEAT repeat protein
VLLAWNLVLVPAALCQTAEPLALPAIIERPAHALGQIGDTSALSDLMEAASSEDRIIRHGAIGALGALKDARAENLLLKLAKESEDSNTRYSAREALRSAGTAGVIPALRERLPRSPTERARRHRGHHQKAGRA